MLFDCVYLFVFCESKGLFCLFEVVCNCCEVVVVVEWVFCFSGRWLFEIWFFC